MLIQLVNEQLFGTHCQLIMEKEDYFYNGTTELRNPRNIDKTRKRINNYVLIKSI